METEEEIKKRIFNNSRQYLPSGFQTIQDFVNYANYEKIPMLLDQDEEEPWKIDLYYFERDKGKIEEAFRQYLPIGTQVNHFVVPDRIEYSEQSLIEYKAELKAE